MNIVEISKKLRIEQTESEKVLWDYLRNRKLEGRKFLRQHPLKFKSEGKIRFFIADFYCAEKKLAIELDGRVHENQKEYDQLRTEMMNDSKIKVVHFKNDELQNIEKVLDTIKRFLLK